MQFDPNKAIYAQIADYYYQQICSGELIPGDKLPSVRETAQLYKLIQIQFQERIWKWIANKLPFQKGGKAHL